MIYGLFTCAVRIGLAPDSFTYLADAFTQLSFKASQNYANRAKHFMPLEICML